MDTVKLFYELGGLAFVLLFFLNGMLARAVLPPKLLDDLQRRKWTGKHLGVVLGAGMVVFILGLVFTELYFWGPFFGLSLAVLLSWLIVWLLAKIWRQLSLLFKTGVLFAVYFVIAVALAVPTVLASRASWMQARGILVLLAVVLVLGLTAAGALLLVASVTAYFVLVGVIARAVLLPPLLALVPSSAPAPLTYRQPSLPLRPQPQEVGLAVFLMYTSLALGPVKVPLDFRFYLAHGFGFFAVINAMVVAFLVFLAVRIGQGRNWARITYIVLFILGLPFFLLSGPGEFARNKLVFLLSITQMGLGIATVRLLIQKRSAAYFQP